MSEAPVLKSASVVIKYAAKSGFRAEWTARSDAACPKPQTPVQTLTHAAREIARVAAVAGGGEEVRKAVEEAIEDVYEDMPQLIPKAAA